MALSVGNLLLSVGVGFDSQLKAADNLFFAAPVDFDDPTRPMFGGAIGNTAGLARPISSTEAEGYLSLNNGIDGDPVAIRQISTADGPRYQVVDGNGKEITIEDSSAGGSATLASTPRYVVKSDGVIYDILTHATAGGAGTWRFCDTSAPFGGTGSGTAAPASIVLDHYARPVARITFKAKEGATLARAQDELSRIGSSVQLLVRLLESIQDESRSFTSIIR